MKNYQSILRLIDSYIIDEIGKSIPRYQITGLYDLYPKEPIEFEGLAIEANWPSPWIKPDMTHEWTGVYIVLGNNLEVSYIGKASLSSSIGTRLNTHFKISEPDNMCLLQGNWNPRPRFVFSVFMPVDRSFEAPSLEEYLILNLQPGSNTLGINQS